MLGCVWELCRAPCPLFYMRDKGVRELSYFVTFVAGAALLFVISERPVRN